MNAVDVYTGPLGDAYWARNQAVVWEQRFVRRAWLRTLAPQWADEPWLEAGCGKRANIYCTDVGVDLVDHGGNLVADIRSMPMFADRVFPVAFCVGVLMHLPDGEWQKGLAELCRVARYVVIIGEYVAPVEHDLRWNPETGTHGDGLPGLLWTRPYAALGGWRKQETWQTPGSEQLRERSFGLASEPMYETPIARRGRRLPGFGSDVTFLVFQRETPLKTA